MMIFGLVPGPSVPLWKALLFFFVVASVTLLFPRSPNKTRDAILFCLYGLVLYLVMWFTQYL